MEPPLFNYVLFLVIGGVFLDVSAQSGYYGTRPPSANICSPCPDGLTNSGSSSAAYGMYCPPCVPIDQSCARGYYLEGQQCIPCPCRVPGSTCQKGSGGEVVCNCPEGYTGRYCDKCAPGFVQQNFYPYACTRITPCIGDQCRPFPEPPPIGCPDQSGNLWPNCTYNNPNPCPPCPYYQQYPYYPPPQPPPIQPPPQYCPPCYQPPPIQPPPIIYPPPRPPPIIYPPPRPIAPCPVQPVCPYPPPQPPCPVQQVCPIPNIPPNVRCPVMPICPIPIQPPIRPPPCPVTPICPIPIQDCNTTCNCECGGTTTTCGGCPPCQCDPRGTLVQNDKQCICKKNVEGAFCDSCKSGYFGLRLSNPAGCTKCFCSGVSSSCSFAPFYKSTSSCTLSSDAKLIDRQGIVYTASVSSGVLQYRFSGGATPDLFWVLPEKLCSGNILTSYGGKLTVGLEYSSSSGSPSVPGADIVIEGTNDFTIYWTAKRGFEPGVVTFSAILDDSDGWLVKDNKRIRPATRDDIMGILASVERILVRATFTPRNMISTMLRGITLEQASLTHPRPAQAAFTLSVEDCSCPMGYTGHSCESCSPTYYRDVSDTSRSMFGACKRCPCRDRNAGCSVEFNGNIICSSSDPLSFTCQQSDYLHAKLTPSRVNCCEGDEIEFSCTYESSRRLEIEMETVPSSFGRLNIKQSSNGVSAAIKLQRGMQKVVCFLKDRINGVNVIVNEATSFIDTRVCETTGGSDQQQNLLYVIASPKFRCYELGETIRFNCSAWSFASSVLTPRWSRSGSKPLPRRAEQPSFGELVIKNAQIDDTGTYYCSAAYGGGLQLDRSVIVVFNKTQELCKCNEIGYPFQEQDDGPRDDGRYNNDDGSILLLENDSIGNLTSTPAPSSLKIPIPKQGVVPQVQIEPAILHSVVGDHIQFNCKLIEGVKEGLTIYWRKKDGTIDLDLGIINDTILSFGPVKMSHAGEYHCIATNAYGKSGDKAELIVHETEAEEIEKLGSAPSEPDNHDDNQDNHESMSLSISISPPGHLVRPGDKVELLCTANEVQADQLKYEWLKEDGIIRHTSSNIEANGQLLVLTSVLPDDSGWYICAATSTTSGDVVTTKFKLVVKAETVAPTVSISQSSPAVVKLGRKIKLECQTYGEPTPVVSWSRFINTPDGMEEQILLESETNVLVFEIRRATKEHEGEYFCSARNDGGEDRVSLLLEVNLGVQCNEETEYRCHSGDQCVTIDDKCDGEKDCRDGSDERHCSNQHTKRHVHGA